MSRADLTVVVPSGRVEPLKWTLSQLAASADRAGARLQVRVPWWGDDLPPDARSVSFVRTVPLSAAYLWNRGLEGAVAPVVAFLPGNGVVSAGWASSILAAYARTPAPGAVHGPVTYAADGRRGRNGEASPEPRDGGASRAAFRVWDRPLAAGGHLALPRRELRRLGGFQQLRDPILAGAVIGRPPSAVELLLRLHRAGRPVLFLPDMALRLEVGPREAADSFRLGVATAEACRRMGRGRLGAGHAARRLLAAAFPGRGDGESRRGALAEAAGVARGMFSSPHRRPPVPDPKPHLPEELAARLDAAALVPHPGSSRAKSHFLYETGDGRMLHWYVNPPSRLRRSLAERERIRSRASVDGIPRLHRAARGHDAVWVLEDRVPGTPLRPATRPTWLADAVEWAVGMAGPSGPPLGSVPSWRRYASRLQRATPSSRRNTVAAALDSVERLEAVHMHGDFRPANLLRASDGRLGAVDWVGAWLRGLPGLDLCFLALCARAGKPDGAVVEALMHRREPPVGPLLGHLGRVGLPADDVPAAVTVMLAIWAMEERRRRRSLGSPPRPARFGALLLEYAAP